MESTGSHKKNNRATAIPAGFTFKKEEFLDISKELIPQVQYERLVVIIENTMAAMESEDDCGNLVLYAKSIRNQLYHYISEHDKLRLLDFLPRSAMAKCNLCNILTEPLVSSVQTEECIECAEDTCVDCVVRCSICKDWVCNKCVIKIHESKTMHKECMQFCRVCEKPLVEIGKRYGEHDVCSQDCLLRSD